LCVTNILQFDGFLALLPISFDAFQSFRLWAKFN
jgi:hypothetical protein